MIQLGRYTPLGNGTYRVNIPRSAITGRYKIERRGMTKEEYEAALVDLKYRTPSLEMFRKMEAYDDNVVWRMETGHLVNLLDMALEEIDRLNAESRLKRSTEWGIHDPWGNHAIAEGFEKARVSVQNMKAAGHKAQIIWRGVTGWMVFGSDEPVDE